MGQRVSMTLEHLGIVELAARAHVSPRQVRYWLQVGLIGAVIHEDGMSRRYVFPTEDADWVIRLSRLVNAGASVEVLAEANRMGRLALCLAELEAGVSEARATLPRWAVGPTLD